MNPDTGQIHTPLEIGTLSRAERRRLESIPTLELARVQAMGTDERKRWAKGRIEARIAKRKKRKAARQARKR